jgi:DMSO/TMAO reductase YedYZ molybdopterin-dependent catalytic subunit
VAERGGDSGKRPVDPAGDRGKPIGRRVVLSILALGTAGVVTGRTISDALAKIAAHDPTGLLNILPFGDNFRYYSVTGSVPVANPATYRLSVTGLVKTEQHYSLTDLAALPQTDIVADFQCVTGWRVLGVPWSGVRLSTILAAAGVTAEAKALRFVSFDGVYTESLTLDQARDPDMIVALRMLNAPVTHDHGGPVRLYAAPMYGYKSIKWLSEIQVVDRVEPGYWEGFGYAINGWVGASNGRNDAPTT